MVTETVEIKNRAGLHARPAALIVKKANEFDSEIYIELDDMKVNGKSIMGIITLGANYKSELKISAEGKDEKEAVDAIVKLFESRFEE
ncbi:MAG: phosphocarrier protein HPr [Spirochaetes bacterium]|nr:MAG: phosphocarrier protein HPr [Spirochaetota bacterium]